MVLSILVVQGKIRDEKQWHCLRINLGRDEFALVCMYMTEAALRNGLSLEFLVSFLFQDKNERQNN